MFQKGHSYAKGGRRKFAEEINEIREVLIEQITEKVKENEILELAKSKIYNQLKMLKSDNRTAVKEIALPIYLKSKADKVEVSTKVLNLK